MSRESHLPTLFNLFRQHGYDGVSLSKIAAATELGKASLYHHFPGGKAEMVQATLDYSQQWFVENVMQVLEAEGSAIARIERMCDRLNTLYANGEQPCLLATLITGTPRDIIHDQVKHRLETMIEAIATLLTNAGLEPTIAKQRGEDAVITIQGALILSRGTDDPSAFQRAIAQLPAKLCEGIE